MNSLKKIYLKGFNELIDATNSTASFDINVLLKSHKTSYLLSDNLSSVTLKGHVPLWSWENWETIYCGSEAATRVIL